MPAPKDPEKYKLWKERLKQRPPPWNKGRTEVYSKETLEKIGKGHRGITLSEEHKKKISDSVKGEKHPLWGTTHSKEWRANISKGRKGKCLGRVKTELEKLKLSQSRIKRKKELGYINSPEARIKISESNKNKPRINFQQEKNHCWKGDEAGYHAIHAWVRKYKLNAEFCEHCGRKPKVIHAANISGKYKRDINDFMWLCPKCHKQYDLRRGKKENGI